MEGDVVEGVEGVVVAVEEPAKKRHQRLPLILMLRWRFVISRCLI